MSRECRLARKWVSWLKTPSGLQNLIMGTYGNTMSDSAWGRTWHSEVISPTERKKDTLQVFPLYHIKDYSRSWSRFQKAFGWVHLCQIPMPSDSHPQYNRIMDFLHNVCLTGSQQTLWSNEMGFPDEKKRKETVTPASSGYLLTHILPTRDTRGR